MNANAIVRAKKFIGDVYAPGIHVTFSIMWFLGLEGSLVFLNGGYRAWELDIQSVVHVVSLLLVLFYLRIVDEMKDYEYDKIYNPDRPLVQGIVSFSELWVYLAMIATIIILINVPFSRNSSLILVMDMIYAIFLMALEKVSATVTQSMFLNLLVTYPVNIALSVYIYMSFLERNIVTFHLPGILIIGACIFAFLHYEIGRKTSWSKNMPRDQRLYSNEIGSNGAIFLWLLLGILTCGILLDLFQPWRDTGVVAAAGWLTIAIMIPVFMGLYQIIWGRGHLSRQSKETRLTSYSMQFLSLFYGIIVLHACIGNKVIFNF